MTGNLLYQIVMYVGCGGVVLSGVMMRVAHDARDAPATPVAVEDKKYAVPSFDSSIPAEIRQSPRFIDIAAAITSIGGLFMAYLGYRSNERDKDRQFEREKMKESEEKVEYEKKIKELEQQSLKAVEQLVITRSESEKLKDEVSRLKGMEFAVNANSVKIGSTNAKQGVVSEELDRVKQLLREKNIIRDDEMPARKSNVNALLVEDDPSAAYAMTYKLKSEGIEVINTTSVSESKILLSHIKFDVLLLDVTLSDGDGTEIMDYVKKNSIETKIIVITGTADESKIKGIQDLKPKAFIIKPFRFAELIQAIRE